MELIGPTNRRTAHRENLTADLIIAGGGLAGTCAAITASREGLDVILVQDRPVLGGNASSEVRLWALGATSHMGNNNRWAREGGVIDEIMTENLWRNPEGNPVVLDAVLLDKAWAEPRLTVLLDTVVCDLHKIGDRIEAIEAYSSPSSTAYRLEAPLFCDATGDGILGHLSGAAFRVGAEEAKEFGEPLAPDHDYGELLGSTIYFYSKDTGKPVTFVAPDFALKDITSIPRYERIGATDHGCSFWWLEYGGRLDTIGDAAAIKKELLKVVYGIWDHIKNSGRFPEAENLTLEWVGTIPGKRESRRFEGDYMLTQADIVGQRIHGDAVSFGGWAIDLHPGDGVYSDRPPCNQYHARGVYQIPYRCLYSRDVPNLFLAGRLISASHVAFGSTRVMMTGAHNGQAVGVAAALCRETGLDPRELSNGDNVTALQRRLLRTGQFVPHLSITDPDDIVPQSVIVVSDTAGIDEFTADGDYHAVSAPEGMLLPLPAGRIPRMEIRLKTDRKVVACFQLRRSEHYGNFSPDTVIEECRIEIPRDFEGAVALEFEAVLERAEYLTVALPAVEGLFLAESLADYPGVLRLRHAANKKVAISAVQEPPPNSGVDRFEFWLPGRRPDARFWAITFTPDLTPYTVESLSGGYDRPFISANAWAYRPKNGRNGEIRLVWDTPRKISRIILSLDGDFDHPMESVQFGHPDRVSPFLPESITLEDESGNIVAERSDVHDSRWDCRLAKPVTTLSLSIRFSGSRGGAVAVYRIRAYEPATLPITSD